MQGALDGPLDGAEVHRPEDPEPVLLRKTLWQVQPEGHSGSREVRLVPLPIHTEPHSLGRELVTLAELQGDKGRRRSSAKRHFHRSLTQELTHTR